MFTPLSPQGPATGLLTVDPAAAARQAGGEARPPIVEPGQSPRNRTDSAADPRRVPPPPRVDADNRPRPRPSSTFLAQAIGQELDAEDGIRSGAPSARTASTLYRQTGETVDRAGFGGLVTPSAAPS